MIMNNSTKVIIAVTVVTAIATGTSIYFFNQHNKLATTILENERIRQFNEAINFLNSKTRVVVDGFKPQSLKPVA
jgi:hypothetical protein